MKYPDIIGSSDKKFRNYSYGRRPGKKLVKYSQLTPKIIDFKAPIKDLRVKRCTVKGIKFAGKVSSQSYLH